MIDMLEAHTFCEHPLLPVEHFVDTREGTFMPERIQADNFPGGVIENIFHHVGTNEPGTASYQHATDCLLTDHTVIPKSFQWKFSWMPCLSPVLRQLRQLNI